MTMTETRRPKQFGGRETEAEKRFDEVMESIKDAIGLQAYIELCDLSGERALNAYDHGVQVGLGKLPPGSEPFANDAILGVSEALKTLSRFVELMAKGEL